MTILNGKKHDMIMLVCGMYGGELFTTICT